MTATAPRSQPLATTLAERTARGDHYGVLALALPLLARGADAVEAAWAACRAYVALGLNGPARELLAARRADLLALPEAGDLRDRLAREPSGRVSWSRTQTGLDDRLAQLFDRWPGLRPLDTLIRAIPRAHELYRSVDGNLHLATRDERGMRRWLPGVLDTRAAVEAARLPDDPSRVVCGSLVVLDDRFASLLRRVFRDTHHMLVTYSPRIYVLEPDPRVFAASVCAAESVEWWVHPRTTLFVGPDCVAQLEAHLREHPGRAAPEYCLRLPGPTGLDPRAVTDAAQRVLAGRQPRAEATLARIAERYRDRTRATWARRFAAPGAEPLRVLGLTSRFTTYLQYSMRDLQAAFEAAGCRFRLHIEETDHDLRPPIETAEAVAEFQPDLVVVIDHHRHEYDPVIPAAVPFVCWVQDLLPNLASRAAGAALGPLDFYIAPQLESFVRNYDYPAGQGLAWTMATCERVYSAAPLPDSELGPRRCDFSYVSHQSLAVDALHAQRRAAFADDALARRLVDACYRRLRETFEAHPATACAGLDPLLEDVQAQEGLRPASPEALANLRIHYFYPVAERLFRHQALEWIADYCDRTGHTLRLYGAGWDAHPRFGRYARGPAGNGAELRAIYQASAINLQIVGTGAVHQRLLDGLAAGGFFLMRYTPGDAVHDAARRVNAALRQYDVRPGVEYRASDCPELADAIQARWNLCGLAKKCERFTLSAERLKFFRALEADGYRGIAGAVFDDYPHVAFDSRATFERAAERFLSDADARRRIATTMRSAVLARFTYGALVDALLAFLTRHLNDRTA
ncbi:MAG: hypothetical protein AB7Q17_04060 [Phycisphaerae bacterium]